MPRTDLLARILDTPSLALVVPRLPPAVLHTVIQNCGLEDCHEIVALATPAQLMRVFDLDLWRSAQPGLAEQLDADRFGVWLEVLMEAGVEVAAEKIAGLDVKLVIAALAQHLRVFDRAAATRPGESSCQIGSYSIVATRTGSWDAIVELLIHLDAERHDDFERVMQGCRRLSNAGFEIDGLDNLLSASKQNLLDLAVARDERREQQGYVAPGDARAFLQMARTFELDETATAPNPIAAAYFRAVDWTPPEDAGAPDDASAATAAVMNVLVDAGVAAQQPRALLHGASEAAPRLARIQRQMQLALDCDPVAHATRIDEFLYLSNTLAAGGSIQSRPFTAREASDAVAAVCNLGLERWPAAGALGDNFLVGHDLIGVFQVGWAALHRDVCLLTAKRLIDVLADLRCGDREIQSSLNTLRRETTKHLRAGSPWLARDALDAIMALDAPSWAALAGLIDECPVMHAAVTSRARTVSASDFEFISEDSQIAAVREFLRSLPDRLVG